MWRGARGVFSCPCRRTAPPTGMRGGRVPLGPLECPFRRGVCSTVFERGRGTTVGVDTRWEHTPTHSQRAEGWIPRTRHAPQHPGIPRREAIQLCLPPYREEDNPLQAPSPPDPYPHQSLVRFTDTPGREKGVSHRGVNNHSLRGRLGKGSSAPLHPMEKVSLPPEDGRSGVHGHDLNSPGGGSRRRVFHHPFRGGEPLSRIARKCSFF